MGKQKTESTDEPIAEQPDTAADTRGDRDRNAEQEPYAFPVPPEYKDRPGVGLLMEACTLYGIDPSVQRKIGHPTNSRHLLKWRHIEGDAVAELPERIVLITAGGLKLAHPADADTVEQLQRVFHCIREVKKPKGEVETIIDPLPDDLTLPTVRVDGIVRTADHQYNKGGYIKEGGASEAARRAARKKSGL